MKKFHILILLYNNEIIIKMLVIRLKAPIFSIGTYCEVKELRGQPLFRTACFPFA